jgi:hypothetical protein
MANSSITVLQTVEWAKRFVFRRPLALGNFLEPAITSANTILQTIIGAPFAWRWNRVATGFITNPGQQDYTIFNWGATTSVSLGYVLVDSNGFSQQVTTAGTTGSTIPTPFNVTVGQTTTDGSAIWTNMGHIGTSNLSQTYSLNWIENASIQDQDQNTCALVWKQITPHLDLALETQTARPHSISAQFDVGNNNVTFRLMPCPDKAYPVVIQLQQKPPIIDGLDDTWSPIPDEYSRLYNWGFLMFMYQFADDNRWQMASQKFVTNLLSTAEGLTDTQLNIWLNNWEQVTGASTVKGQNLQQGHQAKGAI